MTPSPLAAALALALAQAPLAGAAQVPDAALPVGDAGLMDVVDGVDAGVDAGVDVTEAVVQEVAAAAAADKQRDVEAVAAAILRMQKAADALEDFTATFYKKEWKGQQLPEEVIQLKYRASPRRLYFKWTGASYQDQEVIWQRGWNGDRARAHRGSFPDVTVNLPTDHWLMTRYTRHEVPNAGFDFTIAMFARDLVTGRAKPECVQRAADAGLQTLYGASARCYELETDKGKCPEMYARKARLCIYEKLGVPAKVDVWDEEDGALRLVEDYGYGDVKLNVGLSDRDFDPKNKDYDF